MRHPLRKDEPCPQEIRRPIVRGPGETNSPLRVAGDQFPAARHVTLLRSAVVVGPPSAAVARPRQFKPQGQTVVLNVAAADANFVVATLDPADVTVVGRSRITADVAVEQLDELGQALRVVVDRHLPGRQTATILNDDEVAPDTAITGGPAAGSLSSARTARFTFAVLTNLAGGRVTYKVSHDGQPFAPTTSPKSFSNLTDGVLTVAVRAVDAGGFTTLGTAGGTRFVVDNAPPVVSIAPPKSVINGAADFVVVVGDARLKTAALAADQVTLVASPGVAGSVAVTQLDAKRFRVRVSGITGAGTLAVSVAAGVAEDEFGRLSFGQVTSRAVRVR